MCLHLVPGTALFAAEQCHDLCQVVNGIMFFLFIWNHRALPLLLSQCTVFQLRRTQFPHDLLIEEINRLHIGAFFLDRCGQDFLFIDAALGQQIDVVGLGGGQCEEVVFAASPRMRGAFATSSLPACTTV